jgi:arylamine N-acetyltransferase
MPALSSQSAGSPPTPHRRRPPAPPTASHRRYVVSTDRRTPLADGPNNGSDPTSTHSPYRGPLEAAQRVWHHSLELADHCDQLDPSDQALALLRTARHDADTMTHALGLGRSQARHPSNDETTRRGVRLLERAIAFLGVEAQPGQIARPGPR